MRDRDRPSATRPHQLGSAAQAAVRHRHAALPQDPISGFGLGSADYLRVGEDIAARALPTLFVFEGGYAVAEVGVNAVNVLEGFLSRAGG